MLNIVKYNHSLILSIRWWETPDEAPIGTQGIRGKMIFYFVLLSIQSSDTLLLRI
jgi:hypothetical protein